MSIKKRRVVERNVLNKSYLILWGIVNAICRVLFGGHFDGHLRVNLRLLNENQHFLFCSLIPHRKIKSFFRNHFLVLNMFLSLMWNTKDYRKHEGAHTKCLCQYWKRHQSFLQRVGKCIGVEGHHFECLLH